MPALSAAQGRRALFFDRDGVLNLPVWDRHTGTHESPLDVSGVVLAPSAAEAVKLARESGLAVVIVSNQPAAAKELVTRGELEAVHAHVVGLLAEQGAAVDASYLCLHHPDGSDPELGHSCSCRKPAAGLLLDAATDLGLDLARSWLIGDTDADVGAAEAAGLAGVVVVDEPLSGHRRGARARQAPLHAKGAASAARMVLTHLPTAPRDAVGPSL